MKWRAEQSARIERELITLATPDLQGRSGPDPFELRTCPDCTALQDLCPRCERVIEPEPHCGGDCGDCNGCAAGGA